MSAIQFSTHLFKIGSWIILKLPDSASLKLQTRAVTMVEGTVNDYPIKVVLEPDGVGSHWFRFTQTMQNATKAKEDDVVTVEIIPSKEWLEPEVPDDLQKALDGDSKAYTLWEKVTPSAHWDWIRWIRSTNNAETRKHRIEVSCSKLRSGMRRPCCFNRNICTEAEVSNKWVLLDPRQ